MPGFDADSKGELYIPPEVQMQPTDVLVAELLKRCRCGVIRLIDVLTIDNQQKRTSFTQWRGFPHELLGVAAELELAAEHVAIKAMNMHGNDFGK